jgi:DNA polymerase IIIc chi subunit
VIGIARLYCYKKELFFLVDVETKQARKKYKELTQEGWVVAHTDLV